MTPRRFREGQSTPETRAESLVGYKQVVPDDLVVNIMLAWNGSLGVSEHSGIVSPAYCVYRFSEVADPRYYHHLLRSPQYRGRIKAASTGVVESRLRLYSDDLFRIEVLIPTEREQNSIANFIGIFSRRVDHFIHAKRRLIALLNEQKQAIIHRGVTRGLDPYVPLKPSRIDWLGDVPAHWDVVALRMRYSIELGKMLDAKRISGQHLVPYLRNVDVQWDRISTENLPMMDIEPREYDRFTVQPGDLLVCEGGEVGRSAFWNGKLPLCGYQKALHRVRPYDPQQDYSRFLYYVMFAASKRGVFLAEGSENTIAHLTSEKLRRHRMPFPPFDEQRRVACFLDSEIQQFEKAIVQAQREIDLIREYRTRLIADVVTGKLDVRGVELPALDEAADLSSLDGELADGAIEDGAELELMEEAIDAGD